jgi:hypothetical protein
MFNLGSYSIYWVYYYLMLSLGPRGLISAKLTSVSRLEKIRQSGHTVGSAQGDTRVFKESLTQDLRLQVFYLYQFPPSPLISHRDHSKLYKNLKRYKSLLHTTPAIIYLFSYHSMNYPMCIINFFLFTHKFFLKKPFKILFIFFITSNAQIFILCTSSSNARII